MMQIFQQIFGYLTSSQSEYQEVTTELRERQATLVDELSFRDRLVRLIDSLGVPLLVSVAEYSDALEECRDAVDCNDDLKSGTSPLMKAPTLDVYRFAMTLLENLSYERPLSRHQETHRCEILETHPALQDLVEIHSRHIGVDGWLFYGKRTMPGIADMRTARAAVRNSIDARLLRMHRMAEVRAWKEAQHQLKCVSTALTFITCSKPGPDMTTDLQTHSIISAMVDDIRSFSTESQFIPAGPQKSDMARILEPRVFFDEEHIGNLIQTFDNISREYLSKKADAAREALRATRLPFAIMST